MLSFFFCFLVCIFFDNLFFYQRDGRNGNFYLFFFFLINFYILFPFGFFDGLLYFYLALGLFHLCRQIVLKE